LYLDVETPRYPVKEAKMMSPASWSLPSIAPADERQPHMAASLAEQIMQGAPVFIMAGQIVA
jgi:hypothetical protein